MTTKFVMFISLSHYYRNVNFQSLFLRPCFNCMKTKNILIALAFITLCTHDAAAYLDPGSGSYIIQMIIAGFVGGAYAIKLYWQRIVVFFKGRSKSSEDFLEESEDE